MQINHQAIRALRRLLRPKLENMEMARIADSGFDGGEFSGPLHYEAQAKAYDAAEQQIAKAFNIDVGDFEQMLYVAGHEEIDHMLRGGR